MYQKSPIQPMHMQQPSNYIPYPNYSMPPFVPKKKGLLAKLFQKHDPAAPFMQMLPPYRQVGQQAHMSYQQPQYMGGHPQMMQRQPQMMNPYPQMINQNETRGGAESASSGIGTFFSNLISNPTGMLNNVEKVVQVAQSVGPVVEQYSPLVRSIPGLVKMFTSGNSSSEEITEDKEDKEDTKEKQTEEKVSLTPNPKPAVKKKKIKKEPVIEADIKEEQVALPRSEPKLYV